MTVEHEVTKNLLTISETEDGYSKQVNLMRWNDGEEKVDIRNWKEDKPLKGIVLTKQEALLIADAIKENLP